MSIEKRGKAIDLSHHLSELSKARATSPLKGLQKYFSQPGVLSLAGGLPSPAYFPLSDITVNALVSESFALTHAEQASSSVSWFWRLFGSRTTKEKTRSITIPKYPAVAGEINFASALQYGAAVAQGPLQKFLRHFVAEVYQPAIEDYEILINAGSTDGWNRAVFTLCNPGEGVLCEEWTYPSAIAAMMPGSIKPVPVAMDGQGMRSDDLERVLSTWDADVRQMPRPHVMYIIPVGQNPTGSTLSIQRKKEIYDICCKYALDVIILEDDPYHFLQLGEYVLKGQRSFEQSGDAQGYLSNLTPSFLKYDHEGRVIRLDTFSKTIAPGSRLGFFTCSPLFAERLERAGETSTQSPCGFGQAIVTKILETWTYDGYVRWLQGLTTEYTQRRNFMVDCFVDEFMLETGPATIEAWSGCTTYHACYKPKTGALNEKYPLQSRTMFSFVPPIGGMFLWIKLHLDQHPSFVPGSEESLEVKLWTRLAESGVLFGPGWMFASAVMGGETKEAPGHMRISFSLAESSDLQKATKIFGRVIREFFEEQP
ncbi:hypothetical protein HYDPIDRAFT_77313 [Hydnomerulius pinastri MD-312]|nr:hypothetical protein HYDPIDRAFT_77313 [Hydnomerulius pinastri MD-312]